MTDDKTVTARREIAKALHESRMAFCYPEGMSHNQPWPQKLPGDFGYVPQPWVDIVFAQAQAVMELVDGLAN